MPALMLEPAVRTDVGRVRSNNEDAVFASARLAAVADGVGGQAAGEVASRVVIDALAALDKRRVAHGVEDALRAAVADANQRLGFVVSCKPELAGMSTTLTAVALDAGRYVVANIGDSRAYLLRDGVLRQLTRDDSYVQDLVDRGVLTPADARRHPQRSLVLEALDGREACRPTVTVEEARAGDRLLLCSDGLSDLVDDADLRAALMIAEHDRSAERLVALALEAGGRDNVSAVVADVVAGPDAAWA